MQITINPITENLQTLVKQHGEAGWVVLRNSKMCERRNNMPASLVIKNNKMVWLLNSEIR